VGSTRNTNINLLTIIRHYRKYVDKLFIENNNIKLIKDQIKKDIFLKLYLDLHNSINNE